MKYWELTIYVYHKHRYLCKALFESKQLMDSFIAMLQSDIDIVRVGDILFRKKDFKYAEIKEKLVK